MDTQRRCMICGGVTLALVACVSLGSIAYLWVNSDHVRPPPAEPQAA
jgi:hypothetical protein